VREVGVTDLHLREQTWRRGEFAIMAIVNRTPDSFYDKGATFGFRAALDRVHTVVEQGADIVDIGGVKAAPGQEVSVAEEMDRTVEFVAAVRAAYPELVVSVDTWRHDVGQAVCEAGADLLNDSWSGYDPLLAEVAARSRVGLVCTHAGGLSPRSRPHRIAYADVVSDVVATTTRLAERAVALGVDPRSVLIDPAHDFGKNTYHSLHVTRRLDLLVATGWPVLVSLSNKDFIGETLGGLAVGERLVGTLAATAICAWIGARVFRAHNVVETKQTLNMVASIKGDRAPLRALRGLA
jgi:dihydropteroate synthase